MKKYQNGLRSNAFTLVELLVVVGIIALLISILLPALRKARESADMVSCQARMRQVVTACIMYANNNQGYLPPIALGRTNGVYGRPNVVPAASSSTDNGYLNPYLGNDSSQLFCCTISGGNELHGTVDYHGFKYHQILGGDDGVDDSVNKFCIPWRITRVKNSSNQSLWVDGQVSNGNPLRSNLAFNNYGNNVQWVNEANTVSLHSERSLNGTYQRFGIFTEQKRSGFLNFAFVDGSVRAVPTVIDRHPPVGYPDVWIDPSHQQPTW